MVNHSTATDSFCQTSPVPVCAAREMGASERIDLAVESLCGNHSISGLAREHGVSRKFVYQQKAKAEGALQAAFSPPQASDQDSEPVLFSIPVTRSWIEQLVLALVLDCRSSIRGVVELFRDVLDYSISVGRVHGIVSGAVDRARWWNGQESLEAIRIGAQDEIFQNGKPVLVGVDVFSTYCYLLSQEERRDAETWAIRLLELSDRGFHPDATVADGGRGLRAGQALAMPGTPCWADVFHALREVKSLVRFLENRAYGTITARTRLERKRASLVRRGKSTRGVSQKLAHARREEARAIELADTVSVLAQWLSEDILSLSGPDWATRRELFDFVVEHLRALEPQCPHRIGPVVRLLASQRDDLLAFAAQLDQDLASLAAEWEIPVAVARELFNVQLMPPEDPRRWSRDAELRSQLGHRYYPVSVAMEEVAARTVRASSLVENLNSRLRMYFFLRRHLGPDYLALLQFYLNHRRFLRSERPERVGKSPAELLTGEPHAHWLELLGYTRFSRTA